MTTKKAINITENCWHVHASEEELEAIEHLVEIAKRFDNSLSVDEVEKSYWDDSISEEVPEKYFINSKFIATSKTHNLYAIPKDHKMDFNKLREKKRTHWTVNVTLTNDDLTKEIVFVERKDVSEQDRNSLIYEHLKSIYGRRGWLSYTVD